MVIFFASGSYILNDLENLSPDLIVLAGFLKKIPEKIVDLFRNKIVNIHPSLLPKFKGLNTFSKILKNKEKKIIFKKIINTN